MLGKSGKNEKKNLVIIGGGGAGLFTGASVMQLSDKFNVYLISNEDLFCRCSGPYVLKGKAKMKDTIMPDTMITQFGINLLKGDVISVDNKDKSVRYGSDTNGSAKISYDVLVFATGARAFVPLVDGVDKKNVFSVRTPEDIKWISSVSKKSKRAVVVGGGVIGCEMASVLKESGLDVTMMIVEKKPFELLADEEYCSLIENNLKKNKVNILSESMILKIIGNNKVEGIVFKGSNNEEHSLKTDMVVYATGVRANKELAESIGVKIDRRGIIVNDFMQTSLKNIYAVGDVCVAKNAIDGKKSLSQLATNSVIQGGVAGSNISGFKKKYVGHTTATVMQTFDKEYGCCGFNEKMCVKEGIDYYVGNAVSTDIYQDIEGVVPVNVKLIFNKKNNRVIGIECFGKSLVGLVNLISFAIINKSTVYDLLDFNYASHPTVSPWPFMNPIVLASQNAIKK